MGYFSWIFWNLGFYLVDVGDGWWLREEFCGMEEGYLGWNSMSKSKKWKKNVKVCLYYDELVFVVEENW